MTGAEIIGSATFIISCVCVAFAAFWKMYALIAKVEEKALAVQNDLAGYKTHAAEHFATKDGMQRQTDQLLKAIESVAGRIDGLNERFDRVFESPKRRVT